MGAGGNGMSFDQLGFEPRETPPTTQRRPAQRTRRRDAEQMPERVTVASLHTGISVEEVYLVARKDLRTTKAGKPFLRLRVTDRTGGADCMVWEDAERVSGSFQVGDYVLIKARVTEYEGKPQLDASMIAPADPQSLDRKEFLPTTFRDVEELKGFLEFHVESVCDPDYSALLGLIFGDPDFLERFSTAPAAKAYHHAYLGGLLEHTVTVADLCDHVSQQYARVDRDLLITAALLHDVGKVAELTYDRSIDYSDAGKLLGHVILGVTFVTEQAGRLPEFPEYKLRLLLHAIVSHHGELEWGSPKRPKTLEALIIHHVDNLDAKVKGFLEIVEGSRDAPWTDVKNLFRRPLHMPRASHQEEGFLPPLEEAFPGETAG
jgi:3'-5' exoribonuclease